MKAFCLMLMALLLTGRVWSEQAMPYLLKFEGNLSSGAPLTNSGSQSSPAARKDGGYVNYVKGAANVRFGDVAYEYKSGGASVVLGDRSTSLGATAESGFTLSFHIKTQSTAAWEDFLSFCIGTTDVRLERNGSTQYVLFRAREGDSSPDFDSAVVGGPWCLNAGSILR